MVLPTSYNISAGKSERLLIFAVCVDSSSCECWVSWVPLYVFRRADVTRRRRELLGDLLEDLRRKTPLDSLRRPIVVYVAAIIFLRADK